MSTPILYPDGLLELILLTSATYPAGFSHALYSQWRGAVRVITTEYLAFLVLPFAVVGPVAWALCPGLFPLSDWVRHSDPVWILVALCLVPVALLMEYLVGAVSLFVASGGRGPLLRPFSLATLWNRRLSWLDFLFLGMVVVGEEIFYRAIWLMGLHSLLGLPLTLALPLSALAYGLNHLAFGPGAVFTKTLTGMLYGTLFLLGHQNLLLPILAHALQNVVLLLISQRAFYSQQQGSTYRNK